MVEACRLSSVTRAANCFFVPLSRSECASTIAPGICYQHHSSLHNIFALAWQICIGHEQLIHCQFGSPADCPQSRRMQNHLPYSTLPDLLQPSLQQAQQGQSSIETLFLSNVVNHLWAFSPPGALASFRRDLHLRTSFLRHMQTPRPTLNVRPSDASCLYQGPLTWLV